MARIAHLKMEETISGNSAEVDRLETSVSQLREKSAGEKLLVLEQRLADAGHQLSVACQSKHFLELVNSGCEDAARTSSSADVLHPRAIESAMASEALALQNGNSIVGHRSGTLPLEQE